MTLRAIITPTLSVGGQPRFNVGVSGEAPSGQHVYRPRYLIAGPWCRSTARRHAKRLQGELNRNLHGALFGWLKPL
jgi:hypothetical protein